MSPQIIVVSNKSQSEWLSNISAALSPLGDVQIMSEYDVDDQIGQMTPSLIIIDAGAIESDVSVDVSNVRALRPELPVVVVTTSPTWRRARSMFMAGAADYMRKSFDVKHIVSVCRELLNYSLAIIAPIALFTNKPGIFERY